MNRTSWEVNEIKERLINNNELVERGLIILYNLQTKDEKKLFNTHHVNKKGFNKFDANILSSFAEQLLENKHLSPRQLQIARKRILKYSKQLTEIANQKLQQKYEQQSLI